MSLIVSQAVNTSTVDAIQTINSVTITVAYGSGGGVVGDGNYDGGTPTSIYLTSQSIDGGTII